MNLYSKVSSTMKLIQIISVALVLVLSPHFFGQAKSEVTTKIHLQWAMESKTRILAQFYVLGVRDALYYLPIKNQSLCVNDLTINLDPEKMMDMYISYVLKIKSRTNWAITGNFPVSLMIKDFFVEMYPNPNCKN